MSYKVNTLSSFKQNVQGPKVLSSDGMKNKQSDLTYKSPRSCFFSLDDVASF